MKYNEGQSVFMTFFWATILTASLLSGQWIIALLAFYQLEFKWS